MEGHEVISNLTFAFTYFTLLYKALEETRMLRLGKMGTDLANFFYNSQNVMLLLWGYYLFYTRNVTQFYSGKFIYSVVHKVYTSVTLCFLLPEKNMFWQSGLKEVGITTKHPVITAEKSNMPIIHAVHFVKKKALSMSRCNWCFDTSPVNYPLVTNLSSSSISRRVVPLPSLIWSMIPIGYSPLTWFLVSSVVLKFSASSS